jgi:outer membrane lipoprotein-sorting protein
MKKFLIPVVVLTMTLVFFDKALTAEFSAEMISKSQGQTMHSKVYMKNNKIRMETKGEGIHSIVRMDKNVMWVVMPEEKSYMEVQSDQTPIPGEKMKGEVSRKYIGSETVNGYSTKKYEVIIKDGEISDKAYQWVSTDLNYPIKISAVDGSWSTEYKNIKKGSQPDSLFELPAGYEKMAMPGLPGIVPEAGVLPGRKGKK